MKALLILFIIGLFLTAGCVQLSSSNEINQDNILKESGNVSEQIVNVGEDLSEIISSI